MSALRNRRALVVAVVAAVALTLAAAVLVIGGGDDAQDEASFRKSAQKICVEARTRVAALPRPRGLSELADVSADVSVVADAARTKLAALEPPGAAAPEVAKLLDALGEQVRLIRGVEEAAREGQRERARRLIARGEAADRAAGRLAAGLRLAACGQLAGR